MSGSIDLNETYDLLLRPRKGNAPRFQLGASTFEATTAQFSDLNALGFNERDTLEFAILASMRVGRFTSLAKINPLEKPKAVSLLNIPIFYLYTDDERRAFTIAGVGGIKDAMRFKVDNNPNALLPVALIVEHNQQIVRAADFNAALFDKLNRGLAHEGRFGSFIEGKSFESVRTPNNLFGLKAEAEVEITPSMF